MWLMGRVYKLLLLCMLSGTACAMNRDRGGGSRHLLLLALLLDVRHGRIMRRVG